jgi:hypothetical protein
MRPAILFILIVRVAFAGASRARAEMNRGAAEGKMFFQKKAASATP